MYQLNNSLTVSGKPVGYEEFLNQMVEALGITVDRRPKGRSGMTKINQDKLAQIKIPLPPLETQRQVVERLDLQM